MEEKKTLPETTTTYQLRLDGKQALFYDPMARLVKAINTENINSGDIAELVLNEVRTWEDLRVHCSFSSTSSLGVCLLNVVPVQRLSFVEDEPVVINEETVTAERARQKSLGFDAARDDKTGVDELGRFARGYVRNGKFLQAVALLQAACEVEDRRRALGTWPKKGLDLEDRTEGGVRDRLRIIEGQTSVRTDQLREAYVLDVSDLLRRAHTQAEKMAQAQQALS